MMAICNTGSFYLSVSLSFYNLDQYLDFLLPCEVSLILQTQASTKLGPARYITAITEQLSPPPGLLICSVIIIGTNSQVVRYRY